YDVQKRSVSYVSPSVDCDGAPAWSPDGKHVAFLRKPGIPFGFQAQQGSGGIGNPPGPAVGRGGGPVRGCGFGGFGGGGGFGQDTVRRRGAPGFFDATFPQGYTLSIMIADVTKCTHLADGCQARELWHSAAGDRVFSNINTIVWAADHIIFPLSSPADEFERYYSINVANPQAQPIMLTTTDGLI